MKKHQSSGYIHNQRTDRSLEKHAIFGFTLVELLIVIGILAILSLAAVVVLNPAQFLAQSRDANRVNDIKLIERAMNAAIATGGLIDNTQQNRVYISLPDTNGDTLCTEYAGLSSLSAGWEYRCMAPAANLREVDGSGWIPMDLTSLSGMNPPLSLLPIDPENTEVYHYAYAQRAVLGDYSITARVESMKYQPYAANDGGLATTLFETAPIAWAPWVCGDVLVDTRDGAAYATVLIGTECWMRQNMNIGTRVDGNQGQGSDCSSASAIEKYCYGNIVANCDSNNPTYPDGGLYQWGQAMCGSSVPGAQGICPTGWHIPSDAEQYTLENYLTDVAQPCNAGRINDFSCISAGTKLKTGGSSGFNAQLTGYRHGDGTFYSRGTGTELWSSTATEWCRYLDAGQAGVYRELSNTGRGSSVRCVQN